MPTRSARKVSRRTRLKLSKRLMLGLQPLALSSRTDHSARAFYSPAADYIQIPMREVFTATPTSTSTECYYSTLLHELAHWTGNKSRLDRLSMKNGFGSEGYAMEELVAELASAFQCALLDISPSPREDHAKYLNNWLKVLKDDPKAIFKAAAAAGESSQVHRRLATTITRGGGVSRQRRKTNEIN